MSEVVSMGYIIVVSYESDAERKRVDYLVDKWATRIPPEKAQGGYSASR
ncbi:hypothetical protein [Thermococcus sp. JCM 11816]